MLQRQGDILLVPAAHPGFTTPRGALTTTPLEQGRIVLAHGEVTGHSHSLAAGTAVLARDTAGTTYLTVDQLTAVEHQEHGPLTLVPGMYEVRRQIEYNEANEIRQVAD